MWLLYVTPVYENRSVDDPRTISAVSIAANVLEKLITTQYPTPSYLEKDKLLPWAVK